MILNTIGRNSSFTKKVGLIIDSSRSGACFSSCLTSSIYFYITKKCLLDRVTLCFCVGTHHFHSLKPISRPCSMEKVFPRAWRIAIPTSLMRVEHFLFVVCRVEVRKFSGLPIWLFGTREACDQKDPGD